jgi:hypothetical protein
MKNEYTPLEGIRKTFKSRSGVVIPMVIVLTTIVYIAFYSYHNMAMNTLDHAHYTMLLQSVRNIAFSVVNVVYPYISYKCRVDPAGDLARFISDSDDNDFVIDPAGDPVLGSLFDQFKPAIVENIYIKALARESEGGSDLGQTSGELYSDPFEKKVIVEVGCVIYINKIRYECKIKRRISKIFSTVPLYSKFTLMIRNKTIPRMAYNLFCNTIAGQPMQHNRFLPLTLYNHNPGEDSSLAGFATSPKAYLARGYIYFGSEAILNKTSGFNPQFSELFHFINAGFNPGVTRCYSNLGGLLPFVQPNPPGGYQIEFTPLGYYYDMIADASAPNIMKKYMGLPTFSSTLHLYGSQERPSPALVVGRVYQSYPVYKCLVNDLNQNSKIESTPDLEHSMVNALPNKNDFFASSTDLTELPVLFKIRSADAHGSWKDFCDNLYPNYSKMMTTIIKEPYNRSYNYMLYDGFMSQNTQAGTINKLDDSEINDCLNVHNFKITLKNSSGDETTMFSGDPGAADITAILKSRVEKKYRNETEFFKECLSGRVLNIPYCVVAIENGGVSFPDNLKVAEGGIIFIAEGDCEARGIEAPFHQILSIYCARGSIKLDCSKKYKYVSLNAPEGFVKNTSPSSALDLIGNVVCKNLDHLSFAAGGKIQYSHYLDPTYTKAAACRYKLVLMPSVLNLEFKRK